MTMSKDASQAADEAASGATSPLNTHPLLPNLQDYMPASLRSALDSRNTPVKGSGGSSPGGGTPQGKVAGVAMNRAQHLRRLSNVGNQLAGLGALGGMGSLPGSPAQDGSGSPSSLSSFLPAQLRGRLEERAKEQLNSPARSSPGGGDLGSTVHLTRTHQLRRRNSELMQLSSLQAATPSPLKDLMPQHLKDRLAVSHSHFAAGSPGASPGQRGGGEVTGVNLTRTDQLRRRNSVEQLMNPNMSPSRGGGGVGLGNQSPLQQFVPEHLRARLDQRDVQRHEASPYVEREDGKEGGGAGDRTSTYSC